MASIAIIPTYCWNDTPYPYTVSIRWQSALPLTLLTHWGCYDRTGNGPLRTSSFPAARDAGTTVRGPGRILHTVYTYILYTRYCRFVPHDDEREADVGQTAGTAHGRAAAVALDGRGFVMAGEARRRTLCELGE